MGRVWRAGTCHQVMKLQAERQCNLISGAGDERGNVLARLRILMTLISIRRTMMAVTPALAPVVPLALVALMSAAGVVAVHAQSGFPQEQVTDVAGPTPDRATQIDQLRRAAVRLPIAAGLAVILALRPRRKSTPHPPAPPPPTHP